MEPYSQALFATPEDIVILSWVEAAKLSGAAR
jgi:hypothetical protein